MPSRADSLYAALRAIADAEKRCSAGRSSRTRRAARPSWGTAASLLIDGGTHPALDGGTRARLARLLSDFRSATSLHWAKWPISIVAADHEARLGSARGVAKASQRFRLACRAHLKIDF